MEHCSEIDTSRMTISAIGRREEGVNEGAVGTGTGKEEREDCWRSSR